MTATHIPQYRLIKRRSRIIRGIWAACLPLNHARVLLQHGLFWNYGGVGRVSAAYWSSLTVTDPIAAALSFARPRIGTLASSVLIATIDFPAQRFGGTPPWEEAGETSR